MTIPLKTREIEALRMAGDGLGVKEAARKTGLSTHTVCDYRKSAMRALCAKTMPQAVALAMRGGLIK